MCAVISTLSAQTISWTDISSTHALPAGVKLFAGTRSSPALSAWYLDIDMNNSAIAVRPYLTPAPANVATLTSTFGAIASVNGGVFSGSQSVSAVIYPSEVKAQNIASVTRNGQQYPVIRSFFGIDRNRNMRVDWIYHFDASLSGLRTFTAPLPYSFNDPAPKPAPLASQGSLIQDLLVGIGGVPVLAKGGQVRITYNEEIVWGSGIAIDTAAPDPRTAVGHTTQKHCIILVADGRGVNGSAGLGLGELARVMISLGCVEAVNLDGGGSTQLAVGKSTVNGQSDRAVPSILSVVVADSMNLPKTPTFEKVIDSGDPECSFVGPGWFDSANLGYYGSTRSKLNPAGDGSSLAVFHPTLPRAAQYTLFAWWVASSNRCTRTPFIISHAGARDTVFMDQSAAGSQWVQIGTYHFAGGGTDSVVITNLSNETSKYVVVDAIRLVSYDPLLTHAPLYTQQAAHFGLSQNFPNPFNPTTSFKFEVPSFEFVSLKVLDVLGREVATLVDEYRQPGVYLARWDATGFPSGVYFYRIRAGGFTDTKKMILAR